LLRGLAHHEFEVEAEPLFLGFGLECDVLPGVVASDLLDSNLLCVSKILDKQDHCLSHLVLGLEEQAEAEIGGIVDSQQPILRSAKLFACAWLMSINSHSPGDSLCAFFSLFVFFWHDFARAQLSHAKN